MKRPRAEDSGASSGRRGCQYGRCKRFGWLENGKGPYYPFCEVWHQNFHFSDLYEKYRHGGAHVREQPEGICMLPRCNLPVRVIDSITEESYDFCKQGHVEEYIQVVSERWDLEGRVCKLDGCKNHVRVEETSKKIRDHCCRGHGCEAAAARGTLAAAEKRKLEAAAAANGVSPAPLGAPIVQSAKTDVGNAPTRGDDIRERSVPQGDPRQDRQAIEGERGYNSIDFNDDILNCLKSIYITGDISKADPKRVFCRVENVTGFQPWDKVEGYVPSFFLHELRSSGPNNRTSIGGFRWKRSSRPHGNKRSDERIETKYYSYSRHDHLYINKGTSEGFDEVWKLHEYALCADYAKELTGGKLPLKKPVISKIFKEKKARRGHRPRPLEVDTRGKDLSGEDSNNAPGPGRTTPQGEEGLQGTNSNESDELAFQDSPTELMANQLSVPAGAFGELDGSAFLDYLFEESWCMDGNCAPYEG